MGVVHKDVKSPNYLIANGNILKLTNFGITKDLEVTISNATESPSCQRKELILLPTYDMLAYGVVVWELFTTEAPFKGLEPEVVVMRICGDDQRLPIPDDCPKHVADIICECWQGDWGRRTSIDHVLVLVRILLDKMFHKYLTS